MNAIIFIVILINLIIHRYLSSYWEQGLLPYGAGFTLFANLLAVIYLFNFIWHFGFIFGIILSLLCFFQIIYSSFLWPFLLPWLKSTYKRNEFPPVNPYAYGIWSHMIIGLLILTVVNLFITDFKSLQYLLTINLYRNKLLLSGVIFIFIISNLIRIIIMKSLLRYNTTTPENKSFLNNNKENSNTTTYAYV